MPAGFDTMTSLSIDVRARTHGRVDDLTTIYAQVFAADETTPLTNEVAVAANPGVTAWTTVTGISFAGVVPGTKSQWDGARLRIRFAHAAVGSADSTQVRITSIGVGGSYATGSGEPGEPPATPPPAGDTTAPPATAPPSTGSTGSASVGAGIWLSQGEISGLPMSGSAWTAVKAAADGSLGTARVSDQSSEHDVKTLAVALVYARTGSPRTERRPPTRS